LKNNPFTHFDPYGLEGVSWSDSSMEFGNHFCSNFLGSAIDPVGACFNCDNSLTGAAYYGNFAGRAAGVCCSIAFWEYTAARMTASAIGNCAKGVGRPLFQRVMGQTTKRVGSQLVEQRSASLSAQKMVDSFPKMMNVTKQEVFEIGKQAGRNHFVPDRNAIGAHSVLRRDPSTGKINHYETFRPQTNPRNPSLWESVKRYDGPGNVDGRHYNKILKKYIDTPHTHDPITPGGVRLPEQWEIPN
jgi:hypothetical protein